jgi:hypothetical protein
MGVPLRVRVVGEWCRLFYRSSVIIPNMSMLSSRGSRTEMMNVAWACLHCNAHKWAYSDGEDPVSGQRVALFNPRTQRWEEDLPLSEHGSFAIVESSTHGGTTVARLQMSHPNLASIRCLLAALGIS